MEKDKRCKLLVFSPFVTLVNGAVVVVHNMRSFDLKFKVILHRKWQQPNTVTKQNFSIFRQCHSWNPPVQSNIHTFQTRSCYNENIFTMSNKYGISEQKIGQKHYVCKIIPSLRLFFLFYVCVEATIFLVEFIDYM